MTIGARLYRALPSLAFVAGCGRIGYDELAFVAPDAAPAMCPGDMTEVSPGTSVAGVTSVAKVCIEYTERGTEPWTVGKDQCSALARRLCTDAEWFSACVNAKGLVDMIDGGFEWVAEEMDGVALKRGSTDCTVMSSHAIVDPYEFRCCGDY